MKFSVLMSIYKKDNPHFLKLSLESIYEKQSRKPDEIVLICDGPLTSELYDVIDSFISDKSEMIKILNLEKNAGLGNALKIGSVQCSYEYILRMDADDISASDRFEKQLLYAEKHPELDCIGTYIEEFEEVPGEGRRIRRVPQNHKEIAAMSKSRNPMNHVSVCMKKSALEKCGGYKEIPLLEDYYLWLRMINSGCCLGNLCEPLVYVRVGNGFTSKRGSRQRIIGWKILQKYMIQNNMITRFKAVKNMIYIYIFVNMPNSLRKIIYDKFLRN